MRRPGTSAKARSKPATTRWRLRLYVADETPACVNSYANLKRLCEEHLRGRYSIEVVDVLENPRLARGDQIVAIPTLVRRSPQPRRVVIGDLSDTDKALVGLRLS